MMIKSIVFDLDGTLLDSAPLIANLLNGMRAEIDLDPLPSSLFRRWISLGANELVGRAMEASERKKIAKLVVEFRKRYQELKTPVNSLFPGVLATIPSLAECGIALAICSNKPERLCRKVLEDTRLAQYFIVIAGGDTTELPKPFSEPLNYVLKELGGDAQSSLLVGDSTVDQKTAHAAGVPFMFFTGGYDDGVNSAAATWSIDSIEQITTALTLPLSPHTLSRMP